MLFKVRADFVFYEYVMIYMKERFLCIKILLNDLIVFGI